MDHNSITVQEKSGVIIEVARL